MNEWQGCQWECGILAALAQRRRHYLYMYASHTLPMRIDIGGRSYRKPLINKPRWYQSSFLHCIIIIQANMHKHINTNARAYIH